MDVGHFKRARKQADLTQQRAAAKLRVCQSYLSMMENGPKGIVARTRAKDGSRLQALAGFIPAERGTMGSKDC